MTVWLRWEAIDSATPVTEVGGKALQLAQLTREGYRVPPGGCIPASVYSQAVTAEGFRERLAMELGRKPFQEMRWEELWDASLRIRNWFGRLTLPQPLTDQLTAHLEQTFGDRPVAVRSSAPNEDGKHTSFAGLHDSYVGVCGAEAILHHMRLVWASLWSDRALLYRQELDLDVRNSSMAVVVQDFVDGLPSGVAFSQNPLNPLQGIVEAVRGRGEDFVDGTLEPDRWFLDRATRAVVASEYTETQPCLSESSVTALYALVYSLEERRGAPQDMEWTVYEETEYVLQARAITTTADVDPHGEDKRPWYMTLTRSLPELQRLCQHITDDLLPQWTAQADHFASVDLSALSDDALVGHVERSRQALRYALDAYWEYCIPFAHGMRLFGIVYNDRMHPDDPHEFMKLLSGVSLISKERDRALRALGAALQISPSTTAEHEVTTRAWLQRHAPDMLLKHGLAVASERIQMLATRLAESDNPSMVEQTMPHREELFLATFTEAEKALGTELLRIGRESYALRDNDNHYLNRIEFEVNRGLDEVRQRSEAGTAFPEALLINDEECRDDELAGSRPEEKAVDEGIRGKQLVGQPSSPGVAVGCARVIREEGDLFAVKRGDVLVCDAISPAMTFVVPLCAAIVERRGGMLIHGAIIAREYGIPCVTGIAGVTDLIYTGQTVSVDGYLGHVAVRVEETVGAPQQPREC
jgi:pyruvate,water dikinase